MLRRTFFKLAAGMVLSMAVVVPGLVQSKVSLTAPPHRTIVRTIGKGGDYPTIQEWSDDTSYDLVAANVTEVGQVVHGEVDAYFGRGIYAGGKGSDGMVLIEGATTDRTRYREVR